MMSVVGAGAPVQTQRAYSDPVIFRDDRVLRTLLKKEPKYIPHPAYFTAVQSELKPAMRKEVADWMLEICEYQHAQPEVFCLAMNYLDRFLSVCPIGRSQLQLLGAVCLMVSWKVREHEPLAAIRLVEYSDGNLTSVDIMEWEVLLLSKLDWDMSAVIASDFIEHIIQRVRRLNIISFWSSDVVRRHAETLITMCSAHYCFSGLAPSLVATAAVLTTLRPIIDKEQPGDMTAVLEALEKATQLDRELVLDTMDRIETMMHASLPPSPTTEQDKSEGEEEVDEGEESFNPGQETSTPTKILEVAKKCAK